LKNERQKHPQTCLEQEVPSHAALSNPTVHLECQSSLVFKEAKHPPIRGKGRFVLEV